MNISHTNSLSRRAPSQAWRLCLSLLQIASNSLNGLARAFAGLAFGAACLTTPLSAEMQFGSTGAQGGFEGGAADWGKDANGNDTGPWHQVPANAFEVTSGAREGNKSVRFLPKSGEIRSEFTINGGLGGFDFGTEYWEGFSIKVLQRCPGNRIIFQHHSTPALVGGSTDWLHAAGECDFLIRTTENDEFIINTATIADNVDGMTTEYPAGSGNFYYHTQTGHAAWGTEQTPASGGIAYDIDCWYDFVLHFKLSSERTGANAGIVQLWMRKVANISAPGPWTMLIDKPQTVSVYRYDSGKPTAAAIAQGIGYRDGLPKQPKNTQKLGLYYGSVVGGETVYDSVRIWKVTPGDTTSHFNDVAPGGGGGGPVPDAPSTLTATKDATNPTSQINLSWADVEDETGYSIERKSGSGGTYAETATTGTNQNALSDTGLAADTQYFYKVRSYNANGYSTSYSPEANATTDAGGTGAFQMVGNQVVMEAEHAHTRTAGTPTAYNWSDVTESGASGAGSNNAIQSLPNTTDVVVATPSTVACRADYQISVPAGSVTDFRVHVRGRGVTGADNSINVSIDGSTATYQTIGNLPVSGTLGAWVVSGGTLTIPSGTHTVTVWMRENGAIIDKIVVKSDTAQITGTGPAESSQGGTNSVPVITTTTLPGTIAGEAYSQTLTATGGDGALVWTVDSGSLPAGLSLSTAGVISGSATTAGTANFTVRVADSDGVTGSTDEDIQALSLVVTANSVPSITTTTLPGTITGEAYSQTLAATGGNGGLTWSVSSGALPAGLSLSSGGVISGNATTAGTANFTVRVADSDGVTGSTDEDTQALSIVVTANSVPVITTTTLPGGTVGAAYSQTLAATGGNGSLTWSVSAGALPAGLSLSSGGVISGTPTTAATSNFTVRVADSDSNTGASDEDTQALSIVVVSGGPITLISEAFTTSPASNFTVSGGTWSVTGGKYVLTSPVNGAAGAALSNRSIHNTSLSGNWTLTVDGSTTATASAWNDFGVIFGYQDASNYYYAAFNESNDDGTSGIFKFAGGVETQLADITSLITAGTTYAVKIVKSGSTHQVYLNSVLVATVTDATWAAGKVGLGTRNDGATYDNLVVTTP